MLGVRLNSFNDSGITEPDQDANSALTELDKGLRSGRVGEQCEAIVRFPRLFEKYPFPILINSSFLKLADVFRMGNNFLRLWVLRVCQQSEKHLDKILNVDEFVRRVFNVFHSNDPVARALTLKTLGAVASIIPEKQNIHHAIRRALDSHDSVEVEAAIYAASQFAAQSKAFAVSMCNKISEMIRGQATPAGMKLRLLPCLRHMHHSAAAAGPVRELLTSLLPRLPAAPFVRLILHTLTDLAASTLIDIPDQVSLLLEQLGAARASIRATAVSGLRRLAGVGRANLWPQQAPTTLAVRALTLSQSDPNTLANCLGVLEILMKEPLMIQANMHPESAVRELARQSLYSQDLMVASKAAHILTVIAVHCYQESLPVHDIEELMISLESLIIVTGQCDVDGEDNKPNLQQLKLTLKCVVQICECSATQCSRLVNLLGSELESCDVGQRQENISTALGAVGSKRPHHVLVALPNILRTLNKLQCCVVENENAHSLESIVLLCTVVFQCVAQHAWPQPMLDAINSSILNTNLWIQFRVARAAMRYGQHSVATEILSRVAGRAGSELAHHWLGALQLLAGAEACLQGATPQTLQKNVRNANTLYHQAMAALKAGWSGGQCSPFQWEYVRLRGEMLGALGRVLAVCRAFCAQPPPAIALSQAQTSRDEFLRCGHITQQLRRAGAELRSLAEGYCKLYQQSFDADPNTLEHIQILQQMCSLMAQSLERVSTTSLQDQATPDFIYSQDLSNCCLESQILISTCRRVNDISTKMMETQEVKPIITHKQVEGIWLECAVVCGTPLPLPRFLFQPLQHTALRLAVSPQPRAPQDHHSVPHNHHLTVKVEGVIQTGAKANLFRTPTSVQLTLTAHMHKSTDYKGEPTAPFLTLTERVKPAHDFFSCKLLVNLAGANNAANNNNMNAAAGNNNAASNTTGPTLVLLAIEAALLDQTGALWKTGPRHTLNIRVLEDTSAKNAQSQAARRF